MPTETEPAARAAGQAAAEALPPTFQDVIMSLQRYWAGAGCVILQPYDNEVGAGTNAPATTLRSLGPDTWRTAYVQGCRRPTDGRYGENPNRTQHYFQFQVLMKPSPDDIQEMYLGSLRAIGIDVDAHDVRFVEDDWESPTLHLLGLFQPFHTGPVPFLPGLFQTQAPVLIFIHPIPGTSVPIRL